MDARERREPGFVFGGFNDKITVDHAAIRKWVESRRGHPVAETRRRGGRIEPQRLRIGFPDQELPESFHQISWAEFFDAFDRSRLAFVYEDAVEDAVESRFYKFVSRHALDGRGG